MQSDVIKLPSRAVQTKIYFLLAAILGTQAISSIHAAKATVSESARDLPVVAQADVIVAGGGVAGAVAALQAAEAGRSVILLESRNYYGQELTATDRCTCLKKFSLPTGVPLPVASCVRYVD